MMSPQEIRPDIWSEDEKAIQEQAKPFLKIFEKLILNLNASEVLKGVCMIKWLSMIVNGPTLLL